MDLTGFLWKNNLNHWEYDLDKLINLIEDLSKNYTGKSQLCKNIGVYGDFFDNLEKKHNIKIKYNFAISGKKDPRFKDVYQNYDWCYQKFIIEGLSHEDMALEANCSKRVIEKWCTEKHRLTQKYRQENKTLNNIQKDLIIGSMLGDGHINKREDQPMFIVNHAKNQKDYLYWKYEMLKDFCNIPPTKREESIKVFNGKEYLCQEQYRLCTRVQDCLKEYREASNYELINKLNKFSLSIWFLDDGYRGDSNWELCIAEYSQEDIELSIKILKERFNLISHQKKDKRYLSLNADSSRTLDKIILNNIPNDMDVIKYKITENNKIKNKQIRKYIKYNSKDVLLSDFCKNNKLDYKYIHYAIKKYNLLTGEDILLFTNSKDVIING